MRVRSTCRVILWSTSSWIQSITKLCRHTGSLLVKSDVSSFKTFSKLSPESIKSIIEDSLAISKRSVLRQAARITGAVDAAKASPHTLPVSRRSAMFGDTPAPFATVSHSTHACEQASSQPLFCKYSGAALAIGCAHQFYKQEVTAAVVNPPRTVSLRAE